MRSRAARIGLAMAIGATIAAAGVGAQGGPAPAAPTAPDRGKVLRAAADALGMERWSDVGTADTRLPGIDIVNTMDFQGSGTSEAGGHMVKTDFHVTLGYNPPGMRFEMTRTGADGAGQHTIQAVRDASAWDESEMGAGLVPGKGTATPMSDAAVKERLLRLWTLPYGVVKAAIAAGDKTSVSTENGAPVIAFPLPGQLAGVMVKATLDANGFITRVETRGGVAAPALTTDTQYSNYADRADVLTDIKTPGHVVRSEGGRTAFEITVKTWETNNPYAVFPIPPNVRNTR